MGRPLSFSRRGLAESQVSSHALVSDAVASCRPAPSPARRCRRFESRRGTPLPRPRHPRTVRAQGSPIRRCGRGNDSLARAHAHRDASSPCGCAPVLEANRGRSSMWVAGVDGCRRIRARGARDAGCDLSGDITVRGRCSRMEWRRARIARRLRVTTSTLGIAESEERYRESRHPERGLRKGVPDSRGREIPRPGSSGVYLRVSSSRRARRRWSPVAPDPHGAESDHVRARRAPQHGIKVATSFRAAVPRTSEEGRTRRQGC